MKNNYENTINLDNINVELIKNQELKKLIQFKLNKTELEEKDLLEITDITLNGRKINGDMNIVDFNELDFFKNLKKIELKNLEISKQYMKKFDNLGEISFENCEIESIEELKKVKKISINKCIICDFYKIENFENLQELEIINMQVNKFEFLKKLNYIENLKIKNIKGFSLEQINFYLPIKHLTVDGMEVLEEDYLLRNYPNLHTFSTEIEKQLEWKENLEKLKQNGIKVLLNDIYEF